MFGSFDILEFRDKEYMVEIKARIRLAFREGIKSFIRTAVPLVPVDTGMARGSFLNLGRLVDIQIPISPKSGNKLYYGPDGTWLPKTPQSGASLSTPEEDIIQDRGDRIIFNFQSQVFHYTLNDFFGLKSNRGYPWNSFVEGRQAFMKTLSESSLFPDIREYILKSTVTFGQGQDIYSPKVRLRTQKKVKA